MPIKALHNSEQAQVIISHLHNENCLEENVKHQSWIICLKMPVAFSAITDNTIIDKSAASSSFEHF